MHSNSIISNQDLLANNSSNSNHNNNNNNKKYDVQSAGNNQAQSLNFAMFNNFEPVSSMLCENRNDFVQEQQKSSFNMNFALQPYATIWPTGTCIKNKEIELKLDEDVLKTNHTLLMASIDNNTSTTANLFELSSMTKNFRINNSGLKIA